MVYRDYCIHLYGMIYMNASVIGLGHNEFERALAERQIRRPLVNQRTQAAALTTAGKFVICADSEVICRWTDALIGYDFHIVKVCDTIEEARAVAASSGYVFLNGRASFWRRIRREMTAAGMMELHQSAKSQIIDLASLLRFDLGA